MVLKALPLLYAEKRLVIKTKEIKDTDIEDLIFKYVSLMTFPKFEGWAILDLYNLESEAVEGHKRWCKILPDAYFCRTVVVPEENKEGVKDIGDEKELSEDKK